MPRLLPTTSEHLPVLLALRLAPGQENWTHHPAETLPEIAGNPLRQAVTILKNDMPVGLFILSRDERVETYAGQPDAHALTLNGLVLDEQCQGRGVGTAAMRLLPRLVQELYPDVTRALLCIHQTNAAAIHVYQKCGWTVLRERQGKRGRLWVMELRVNS